MGQREYDDFKRRLRKWMESHPADYERFENMMIAKDDAGYRLVLQQATMLIPQFRKALRQKAGEGLYEHIDEIERLCGEHALAEKLIREFDNADRATLVPAMLCWLYFGPSFERMKERGEELRRLPGMGYLQKMMIAATIKLLISRSIQLGLRTKQDWIAHREAMRLAESDHVLEWAMKEESTAAAFIDKKKPGRPSTAMPLREMFSSAVTDSDSLIEKISGALTVKHSQTDIARLKIALDELNFLVSPVTVKSFRDALHRQFAPGIHIVHERGVQEAYSRLTDPLSASTKEESWKLQELKKMLSR